MKDINQNNSINHKEPEGIQALPFLDDAVEEVVSALVAMLFRIPSEKQSNLEI